MRSTFVLLAFGVATLACACSAAEPTSAAEADITDDTSPFDDVEYGYELTLFEEEEKLGCDYVVSFDGYGMDTFRADDVRRDRTLKGTIAVPRYLSHEPIGVVGLTVFQHCRPANEDMWPTYGGYRGGSKVDLGSLSPKPGPMRSIALTSPSVLDGPAAASLKMGFKSVAKARPVRDTNCGSMDPSTSNRFFLQVTTNILTAPAGAHPRGLDYERTIALDGEGLVSTDKPLEVRADWFTYCRPQSAGHPDDLHVKVDLTEKDLFSSDVFDSGDGVRIAVGEEGEIVHTHAPTGFEQRTTVKVLR